jgi:hypothetical protein
VLGTSAAGGTADLRAPVVAEITIRRGRRVRVRFRLSEPATIKLIAQRRVKRRWRTLALPVVLPGRRGINTFALPKRVTRGTAGTRFLLSATDGSGNRSVQRTVYLRRR